MKPLSTSWPGLKSNNPEQQVSGPTLQITTFTIRNKPSRFPDLPVDTCRPAEHRKQTLNQSGSLTRSQEAWEEPP